MPGWHTWNLADPSRFNGAVIGPMWTRREGDKCRLRMVPERKHTNVQQNIHGAVILSLIDIALFATMRTVGDGNAGSSVTLELSTQFVGAGQPDRPLDCVVEVVRETGRLMFMRGMVEQEDHIVASFSGIIRKLSQK